MHMEFRVESMSVYFLIVMKYEFVSVSFRKEIDELMLFSILLLYDFYSKN